MLRFSVFAVGLAILLSASWLLGGLAGYGDGALHYLLLYLFAVGVYLVTLLINRLRRR